MLLVLFKLCRRAGRRRRLRFEDTHVEEHLEDAEASLQREEVFCRVLEVFARHIIGEEENGQHEANSDSHSLARYHQRNRRHSLALAEPNSCDARDRVDDENTGEGGEYLTDEAEPERNVDKHLDAHAGGVQNSTE